MRLKSSIRVCMEKQERYATELAREQCSRNRLVAGLYEVSQGYLSSSARINFHTQSVQLHQPESTSTHRASNCNEIASPGTAIILLDFAENFSFVCQDAVQGFHWETCQANLHPVVIHPVLP